MHKRLDACLLQFGHGLKHSDEFHEKANKLAVTVFYKLQEKLKNFKIKEPHFAGSFGKKTDVLCPDLDLVVVVNFNDTTHYEKCRDQVLDQCHDILSFHQKTLKIITEEISLGENSIQFMFENGIEVDLLVAGDFGKDAVLNAIKKEPEKCYLYSPCLVKQSLEFMRAQNSFAHSLVRILKFWYKLLHVSPSGGKLMMELIAVAAARNQKGSQSILSGLFTALAWISKLDTLKLAFLKEKGEWRQIYDCELTDSEGLVRRRIVGSREILERKGFIIDPSNPFNDLLQNVKSYTMDVLKRCADQTRDRLTKAERGQGDPAIFKQTDGVPDFDMFKLFAPEPGYLKQSFPVVSAPPKLYITHNNPFSSQCPVMKVWNEASFKNKEVQLFVDALKFSLLARVNSIQSLLPEEPQHSRSHDPGSNAKATVGKVVEEMIETALQIKFVPAAPRRHEDHDVTLSVPFEAGSEHYAVKLSMKW